MRNDSARRRPIDTLQSFQLASRRAEALDGLVFMMAAALLVLFILGHLLLAFAPGLFGSTAKADGNAEGGSSLTLAGSPDGSGSSDGEEAGGSNDADANLLSGGDFSSPATHGSGSKGLANADVEAYESAAEKLRLKIDALKETNQSLLTENSSLKSAASSMTETDDEEVTKLRESLRQTEGKLAATQRNEIDINQRLLSSESSLGKLRKEFSDLQSQLDRAQTDLASAGSSTASPFAELPNQNADIEALKQEVQQAEAKANSLQVQVASLEQELKSAKDKLASTNMRGDSELSELRNRVTTLQRDLELTTNKMNAREQEFVAATGTLEKLQATNINLRNQLAAAAQRPAASPATGSGLEVTSKPEVFRDYTSSKGSVSKMAFIRWEGEDGIIVRSFADKRLYRLTLDRFSDADKEYLLDRK